MLTLQLLHQRNNLRLDRNVKRRGRFICDQNPRIAGHGDCNHDALLHAAGKLMRIIAQPLRGGRDLQILQQLPGPVERLPLRYFLVFPNIFRNLIADGINRVQ